MKKAISVILLLTLLFGLLLTLNACGGTKAPVSTDTNKDIPENTETPAPNTQTASPPKPDTSPTKPKETPTPTPPEPTPTPDGGLNALTKVGDVIQFGGIDWRVLEVTDGKALVISENIIADAAFNEEQYYNIWKICTLREALNTELYDGIFSELEKTRIYATTVKNENPYYEISGGLDSTDKLFLLSVEEVVRYFGDSGKLALQPDVQYSEGFSDEYDEARIALTLEGKPRTWWLRSAGDRPSYAAVIGYDGYFSDCGEPTSSWYGVRPAMWLSLEGPAPVQPEQSPAPTTYITKGQTFAFDIPAGLMLRRSKNDGPGDRLMIESLTDGWTINVYEHVPISNDSSFGGQKNTVERFFEPEPIIIAGREGFCYQDNNSSDIMISVVFPNLTSDEPWAVYGSFLFQLEEIEGYTFADYLKIPEFKFMLDSIRIPE